ncbi:MAG: hypothetical protein M3070_13380 [Actinomycetota bacterium]|nr:hypothetical protein [Actinomycetota bacterium]
MLRERMGWGPFVRRYDENDTSAYRKRKVRLVDGRVAFRVIRPTFRQMLDDLEGPSSTASSSTTWTGSPVSRVISKT